jgi:flagella basal body P-ring formation protein FlgA
MNIARRLLVPLALAIAAAAPASAAGSAEPESVERLRAMAESVFASADVSIEAAAEIDPRIRMPACTGELRARVVDRSTAEVACEAASGWRLYVPVRVRRFGDVLVLAQTVSAGAPLHSGLVRVERRELGTAQSPLADAGALNGMQARRTLAAGTILTSLEVVATPVVRRGQAVTLIARSGGLEVRAPGKALADAARGQRVAVEAAGSRRVVQGVVRDAAEIEVSL